MELAKLKENARLLPSTAKSVAIASFMPCLNRFPVLKKIDFDQWDFFMTIAGTYLAVSQLHYLEISQSEKNEILDLVIESVQKVCPDAIDAWMNCREFVDRTYDGLQKSEEYKDKEHFLMSDSLGAWIAWNLFERAPEKENEIELIRPLGGLVVQSFATWWKETEEKI